MKVNENKEEIQRLSDRIERLEANARANSWTWGEVDFSALVKIVERMHTRQKQAVEMSDNMKKHLESIVEEVDGLIAKLNLLCKNSKWARASETEISAQLLQTLEFKLKLLRELEG